MGLSFMLRHMDIHNRTQLPASCSHELPRPSFPAPTSYAPTSRMEMYRVFTWRANLEFYAEVTELVLFELSILISMVIGSFRRALDRNPVRTPLHSAWIVVVAVNFSFPALLTLRPLSGTPCRHLSTKTKARVDRWTWNTNTDRHSTFISHNHSNKSFKYVSQT